MRIAVAGLTHETNTYAVACTGPTGIRHFQRLHGDEIGDAFGGTGPAMGGICDGCAGGGHEAVQPFSAGAKPSGPITAEASAELKGSLWAAQKAPLPLDAVALELHGAGVAEGVDDLEA